MRCHFGEDFKNGIAGWYFPAKTIDVAYRQSGILMLDLEYGVRCSLDCNYCFRTNDYRDRMRKNPVPLTSEDIKEVVDDAAKMGAKSIHFVGKGEPLEEKDFLSIVHYIARKKMIPLIFTAGHVLGDDNLAMDIHGKTGEEIAKELYDSKASLILKLNSLNHEIQNDVVQKPTIRYSDGSSHAFNYTKFRDIAFERLIETGFNSTEHNPTRLGTASVMLKSNYHELFHHYRYFRCMNIYPIINTVVPCGRTENMAEVEDISPTEQDKIELWRKIYSFNIENGIKYEGVSSYVGGHICSQLGYALYINVFGEVFECPSSIREKPIGNIKVNHNGGDTLRDLWKRSSNRRKYHGCKDNGCPWRFRHPAMIPRDLFRNVHEYLETKYPDNKHVQDFVLPKYY